ncbi:MAG: phospholipid carrier-dependent glycosyltransferase, partial [Anaerolineaceae bacterium]
MDSVKRFLNRGWVLVLVLFACLGVGVVIYATRWGAALSDDSYTYIHVARDLLAGRASTVNPHFPPFLSLVLTLPGLAGVDPWVGIRWVNALLFGVNIILVGLILRRMTDSSVIALIGGLGALLSTNLVEAHSWAMSEPLFITLILLGWLVYVKSEQPLSSSRAVLLGLCFGLAAFTRYIGVAVLLAGGLTLVIADLKRKHWNWKNWVLYSLAGAAPLLLWSLWAFLLADRAPTRVIAWHPLTPDLLRAGLNTVLLWFFPGRLVHGKELIWLAVLVLSGLGVWALSRWLLRRAPHLDHPGYDLGVWSAASYLVVLAVSRSLVDAAIPMDSRLLAPLWVIVLILLVALGGQLWMSGRWVMRIACLGLLAVVLVTNGTRTAQTVASYHELGRGYASARDHISETYAYLRRDPQIPIYSNAAAAIYFWTGIEAMSIPSSSGVEAMKADMQKRGAYLVVFKSIPVSLYGVTEEDLIR